MKVAYRDSIEYKTLQRVNKIRGNVILRRNFDDLGSYSQISRVFKKLLSEKQIVRISFGVYAKAYLSQYTSSPLIKGGTDSALKEALKKLGITYEPGSAEKEYIAGLTTQIPAKTVVRLKSRCRRMIGYEKVKLIFEKNINAK